MLRKRPCLPIIVGALAIITLRFSAFAQYGSAVVSYTGGSGVNPAFTNPSSALGAPTTFIGYQDADPFNPPYRNTDVVSVGVGGSLTLQMSTPIANNPSHPFGLDFIIFGNAGFVITNGDYTGGGITDGSLFGSNNGSTRVWVSPDNNSWYELNPLLAPTVDTLFPSDSAGNSLLPVNPALNNSSFAGRDLTGIRNLYAGSAGGTGYDLAWAQDSNGNSVNLASVNFVRIIGLSDKADIDAIAAIPEPSAIAIAAMGLAVVGIIRRRQTA